MEIKNYLKKVSVAINLILFAILYIATHYLSQILMFELNSILIVWITIGFALSIYLIVDKKYWLYIWAISVIGEIVFYFYMSGYLDLIQEPGFAAVSNFNIASILIIQKLADTLLPVAIAWSIERILKTRLRFSNVRGVIVFAFTTILLTIMFTTSSFSTILLSSVETTLFGELLHGAVPVILGSLIMVPTIIGLTSIKFKKQYSIKPVKILELFALFGSVFILSHYMFTYSPGSVPLIMEFTALLYPCIFWASFRFHPRITALVLLELVFLLILFTLAISTKLVR